MNIYARSALSACLLVSLLTGVPATHSAEYYIYRDPKGVLVISNQKPPPGSLILKYRNYPDAGESEAPQDQPRPEERPREQADPKKSRAF